MVRLGRMRRKGVGLALVTVFFVGMLMVLPGHAAASMRYVMTGADYQLFLLDNCNQPIAYKANTPVYVIQGWIETPWVTDPPANKSAFEGRTTYFELQIDGVVQKHVLFARYLQPLDWKLKLFISEYDHGFSGTHTFAGYWYIDSLFYGLPPGQPVLDLTCTSVVTFT